MGYAEIIKHPVSGDWYVRHVNRDADTLPPSSSLIGIVALGEVTPEEGQVYEDGVFVDRFVPRPGPRTIPTRDLMLRLRDEYAAIKAARATDAEVDLLWDILMAKDTVNLDDPLTVDGLATLEAKGLIAPGRAAEVRG